MTEHKTKCPTAFFEQMKLSTRAKKIPPSRHTPGLVAGSGCIRLYLLAHCLQRSCADYISYRIQMRHMSALFHSRNGIIVICILMNILQCVYIILCPGLCTSLFNSILLFRRCVFFSIPFFRSISLAFSFLFHILYYNQYSIWISIRENGLFTLNNEHSL